jgi:hypothetical protein
MKRCLAGLAILAVIGCSDPLTVSTDGSMAADVNPWGLSLHGRSTGSLYFMAIDRDAQANTDWYPCVSLTCPSVAGGDVAAIPFGQVAGFNSRTREILVYWWGLVPAPVSQWPYTGLQPDSIRSMIVVRD